MYISKIKILNYKSFLESGNIEFQTGINIITGQNNAGKTSLLQGISLGFSNLPHKSSHNLKSKLSQNGDLSKVKIEIIINKKDLEIYLFENFHQIILPHLNISPTRALPIATFISQFASNDGKLEFIFTN